MLKTPLELLKNRLVDIKADYNYYKSRDLLTEIGITRGEEEIAEYELAIRKIESGSENSIDNKQMPKSLCESCFGHCFVYHNGLRNMNVIVSKCGGYSET